MQGAREVLAEQLGESELPKAEGEAVGEEQVQQRQEEQEEQEEEQQIVVS